MNIIKQKTVNRSFRQKISDRTSILKIRFNADWKKISAVLIIAAMTVSLGWYFLPAGTQATGYGSAPRFNIFTPYTHTQAYNQDYYLLDIKNDTQGTNWNDPISADAGDTLTFSVYYHNGVNDTTARNTMLRVFIPPTVGTRVVSTAYLWADNADNATYNNPFTETGTVNISSPQKLEYIPGSAKWYPNQSDWRIDAPTPFPNGQTGDEIIGSGVNVGDIIGCWEYSGYINFKVKVSNIQQSANITIDKQVRNITNPTTYYADSIAANPRQKLAFQIKITSTGDVDAKNVIVRDILPENLIYVSGSTKLDSWQSLADGIASYNGINIGDIPKGAFKIITFEVSVEREVKFVRGDTVLTNTAYGKADNISEKSDTATITVHYSGCSEQANAPGGR